MKIGRKIALYYIFMTIAIVTGLIVVFYFYNLRYIDRIYYSYLTEKTYIIAQKHWAADELDEKSYELIQKRYHELLPTTKEIIFNVDSVSFDNDSLRRYLSADQIVKLKLQETILFRHGKELGVAIFYPDNEGNFVLLSMAENIYGKKIQKHTFGVMFLLLIAGVVIVYIVGNIYSNRILAPLQKILKELKKIRGSNLNVRIKRAGNRDELDHLALALNSMLDRIDTALSSEKSFIANASHELNNPITAIQGECEITLLKERTPAEYIAALKRISAEGRRITNLTKALLLLSRQNSELQNQNQESISLAEMLNKLCGRNLRLKFSVSQHETFNVDADKYLLEVAIGNIINNACKYSGDKDVLVRLYHRDEKCVLEVEDHGIGIPDKEIERIFQSFYRATNSREFDGHGIGLNLTLKILSIYGASVEVSSKENEFTIVRVVF